MKLCVYVSEYLFNLNTTFACKILDFYFFHFEFLLLFVIIMTNNNYYYNFVFFLYSIVSKICIKTAQGCYLFIYFLYF